MKQVLSFIFIAIGITLVLLYATKHKLGNVRPALLPSKEIGSKESPLHPAERGSEGQAKGKQLNISLNLASGFQIGLFADDTDNARDLEFSPGGTLLVSSPNTRQVYALPDKNNDGIADETKVIISGADHPHGLAFHNGKLFVAEVERVVRYTWDETNLTATVDKVLFTLPANNNHSNRTLVFGKDNRMYVSVGSTCDVCFETNDWSGTIIVSDENGNNPRIFAKGQRNAPFMAMNSFTNELWATGMGRDHLGDNLPPDEINIVRENKDYGWPICYGNRVHDTQFDPTTTSGQVCKNTEAPIYEIAAHSAPLGLTFVNSEQFPVDWQGDLLVAYHGSWNRSTPIGYKVVKMNINGNTISGEEDFLSGFLPASRQGGEGSEAVGRPVDVIFDKQGNLYISDDKAGNVYIIYK